MTPNKISRLAVVECDLPLNAGIEVMEFAIVRQGATLSPGCRIHPHVFVGDGVSLGENVEVLNGAFLGREPKGAGATARKIVFERRIRIGANSSVGPYAVIYFDVEVGENCLVGDFASIREQCRIGDKCIISRHVSLNYNVSIGNRVKVMDATHLTGNMRIEDDAFISTHVATANDNAMGKSGYQDDSISGPTIRSGAVVGAAATLLPRIEIGSGAVVAAGAVVTKPVASNSTVMGMPARPR